MGIVRQYRQSSTAFPQLRCCSQRDNLEQFGYDRAEYYPANQQLYRSLDDEIQSAELVQSFGLGTWTLRKKQKENRQDGPAHRRIG